MRKRKIVGICLIGLVAVLLLVKGAMHLAGKQSLKKAYAALEAAGRPMSLEEILPAPIPDEENAAIEYTQAFVLIENDMITTNDLLQVACDHDCKIDKSVLGMFETWGEEERLSGVLGTVSWQMNHRDACCDYKQQYLHLVQRPSVVRAIELVKLGQMKPSCWYEHCYFEDGEPLVVNSDFLALDFLTDMLAYKAVLESTFEDAGSWADLVACLRLTDAEIAVYQMARDTQVRRLIHAIQKTAATLPVTDAVYKQISERLIFFEASSGFARRIDFDRLVWGEWIFEEIPKESLFYPASCCPCCWPGEPVSVADWIAWKALFVSRDHSANLAYFLKLTRLVEQPYSQEAIVELNQWLESLPWYAILTQLGSGSFIENFVAATMTRAEARITRIGLAAILYQQKHGSYPESFEQVGMQDVLDPFSEKPFIYRREKDGFIIYSIGPNQIDDGGPLAPTSANDDVFWQYTRNIPACR